MIKIRQSLALSFIAIVVPLLLVVQGGLSLWYLLEPWKGSLNEGLKAKIKMAANVVANSAAVSMSASNLDYLNTTVESLSRDEDVISIKVIDREGKVVTGKIARTEDRGESINPFFIPWKNTMRLPVISSGEKLAEVEMVYSGERVNETLGSILKITPFIQGIIFILLIYGFYYFFQRKVGRPIEIINKDIKKATSGDLTVNIPDFGENEIGNIARGIRFLIDGLVSALKKLRSTSENVSMAIDQLNLTFKNVTDGIQKQSESVRAAIGSIKQANDSQERIAEDAGKLVDFSNENVTSLLEMKATADEIVTSTGKLFNATEESYSIVAEMSQTAKTIAQNTGEISSAVDDTSASVEQINASVKEVEGSAKDSASLASRVTEIASEVGMMAVVDAVEGMEKITEEVKRSADIISRLGARSADIEKILSVIKDVTEQTNLLSLNAAILATQAGEYGKSFSVVADEIRALSDRTASSTRDISSIVKTIQSEIYEAVKSIESGMSRVNEGSGMVFKVGDALRETLSASEQSTDMAKSIERATEEQAGGLRQIALSVDSIRKMMGQVSKATQEHGKGTSYLFDSVSDVKSASDIVKQGIEEEAASIKMISKNLELADDRLKQIEQAASNQQKVNESIMSAMERIKIIGTSTIRDVEEVSLSLSTLHDEIELLKREMSVFKIS